MAHIINRIFVYAAATAGLLLLTSETYDEEWFVIVGVGAVVAVVELLVDRFEL